MANQDSPDIEEDSDKGPSESQRQIPFDAPARVGWEEHATEKESATPKISPSATRGGLNTCRSHFECNRDFSSTDALVDRMMRSE